MDIEFVENLKDDHCDYNEYESSIIEQLLSRVKDSDRQKARELLNDSLTNGLICLSLDDVEDCFFEASEIEYLEFTSAQLAEQTARADSPFIKINGKIKNMLVVISSGDDEEMTMLEVSNCVKEIENSIESATGQKQEPDKMYWSMVQKEPAGFIRLLVQL
ncbi:MAG: hypothetical protein IJ688_08930 [Treponema sp.]|nr:hypothetical protein [Treponema sp.]